MEKKLEIISRGITLKKKGMLLSDFLQYLFLFPIQIIAKYAFRKYLLKIVNSPDMTNEEIICLLDKSFKVNEKCNGCGICSQICPVNNIKMINNKPKWLNHCETCLACYHWCPNRAIKGGVAPTNEYYYHHPDVKISDIMKQKQPDNNKM